MSHGYSYGGTDDNNDQYWLDENGNRVYMDNSSQTSYGAPEDRTIDNDAARNYWEGMGSSYNNNGDPYFGDIPQTAGPGKQSKEAIKQNVSNYPRTRDAMARGMTVMIERNNVVDGYPVSETTMLQRGQPGAGTYTVGVEGSLHRDGSFDASQPQTYSYPALPGSGDSTATTSTGSTGGTGGPSGGGGGGTGGGATASGDASSGGHDCDCGGRGGGASRPPSWPVSVPRRESPYDVVARGAVIGGVRGVNGSGKNEVISYEAASTFYGDKLTPAQRKFEKDYLTPRKISELIRQQEPGTRIDVRFRFFIGEFGADGREIAVEDRVTIQDGTPGSNKYAVYNVNVRSVAETGAIPFGGSIDEGWENGFTHYDRAIEEVDIISTRQLDPSFGFHPANFAPMPVPDTRAVPPPPFLMPIIFLPATNQIVPLRLQPPGLQQTLNDLVRWLNADPQRMLIIAGNTPIPGPLNLIRSFMIDGRRVRTTLGAFMIARARAVINRLIKLGANRVQMRARAGRTGLRGNNPFNVSLISSIDPIPLYGLIELGINLSDEIPPPELKPLNILVDGIRYSR